MSNFKQNAFSYLLHTENERKRENEKMTCICCTFEQYILREGFELSIIL